MIRYIGILMMAAGMAASCASMAKLPKPTADQCSLIQAVIRDVNPSITASEDVLPLSDGDAAFSAEAQAQNMQALRSLGAGMLTDEQIAELVASQHESSLHGMRFNCPEAYRVRRGGYGVTAWSMPGFTSDGRYAVIAFGTQWAPLAGEGQECLFEHNAGNWRIIACRMIWVS